MTKNSQGFGRALPILVVATVAVVALAIAATWLQVVSAAQGSGQQGAANIGGPFSLVDQTGAPVTERTYAGRYRLIYFGYTFCPDACPTELQVMSEAVDALGPQADKVQPIFVTIDPARDTPAQLAAYVPQFDKRLVGLTGSPQQIAAMAKDYKVYYAKAESGGAPDAYAMNHSSFVYLMDPNGRFLTVFSSDTDAEAMTAAIRKYLAQA